MNLVVRNFKSIENLEVEIEESKVNFIVGLSGAGKTSLSQAITDDELLESRVRIGKSREDVERLCNGGPVDSTKFAVFDIEQVSMYKTSAIDGKETYKLLIRDDREIEVAKNEYNELVQNIRDRIDSVFELRDKISRLESSFGGKLTKSTKKLPKSAKILQVKEEIMSLQERHTYDGIFNLGIEGINWIAEGTKFPEFISESKCFFCEQIVPSERKLVVNDIARLTAKKLKPLFEGAGILTEFDIASPDFSNEEEVNAAVQEIEEIQLVNEDLTKILALCKVSDQLITNVDDFEQIVLKEKTKIFLPELTEIVDEINVQIETLKEKAEAIIMNIMRR